MRKYSGFCAAAIAVAILLLATGCGTEVAPASTATVAPKPAASTAPATAATTAAATAPAKPATTAAAAPATPTKAVVKQEGELRYAYSGLSRQTFNPLTAPNHFYSGFPLFDYLFGLKPDGATLEPGLAESWEEAPDGLSWTFKIRKGVKFHNGDDLTAEDVRFSLLGFSQKLQGTPTVATLYTPRLKALVKDVAVVDPYTVRVVMNEREHIPTYLAAIASTDGVVMPKNYIEKVGWAEFEKKPIGSGPWKLVESKSGDYVKYEALPEHWRATPEFKTAVIYSIPEESTRIAMLRNGELDIALISAEAIKQVEQQQALRVHRREQETTYSMWMLIDRSNTMPTANAKVREALTLAIDRDAIIQYVWNGEATKTTLPLLVWNSVTAVNRNALPKVEYNLERAKQLIAEAGYAGGFNMDFWVAATTEMQKLGLVVGDQWSKLGIKVNLQTMEGNTLISAVRENPPKKQYQGSPILFSLSSSGIPIWERLRLLYHTEGTIHLLNSPEGNKMIDAAVAEKDPTKRAGLVTEAVTWVQKQFVTTPIASPKQVFGMSKKIAGWDTWEGSSFYELAGVRKAR